MRNFLARSALLALLLPVSAMAEQFDLVCTFVPIDVHVTPFKATLHVDTDRNTVNGYAAKINKGSIVWEDGIGMTMLDRTTLKFMVTTPLGQKPAGMYFWGNCS